LRPVPLALHHPSAGSLLPRRPLATRWFAPLPALQRGLVALASGLALAAAGRTAVAQPVAGLGDDAIPIPARAWRLSIGATWDQWDQRLLGTGERGPLLGGLSTPSFGAAQLPVLATTESSIRELLGRSDFDLTLGALEASGAVRRATSILRADVGITRRVSLGVRIPYVEVVHDARLVLNRDGTGANVGENPARTNTGAYASNGNVYTALDNARATLAEAVTTCTTASSSPLCAAVLADPAGAASLLERTGRFLNAWRGTYGDGTTTAGAPVVPVAGSGAHEAIGASLASLSDGFERFGAPGVPRAVPAGATLVYGSNGLQSIAQDSAFGVGADTLDRAFRAGMGDIDLEARVLLLDTWNADQTARLTSGRSGVRVLASAGWRFGTASSAQANQPFALATGEGVNALLLRATADAVWRRRAWISVTARTTMHQADNAVVRLPGAGLPDAFFLGTPQAAQRSLGQRFELEIAPRVSLGENFGVSATWAHRTIGSDSYRTGDGTEFSTPSGSAQFGAIGVTYSTLAPFVRGKSKHAVEVLFAHEVALSSSGVIVPSLVRDRLELRIYPGFPRR
jgi:hypothetical protein